MTDLDRIRAAALARIERRERGYKLAIAGAVAAEAVLLLAFLLLANLHDRTHLLLLVSAILVYTTLALGLAALGAHVSRAAERIVAAIELVGAGGEVVR
ncbi:MAG TPA: hypothetical protein VJT67_05110 [Longimicrobiaceae bacterium]|nr:hypothetical protein [Longimicrobiaceae bacterium]